MTKIVVGMKIKGWRFAPVGKYHDGSGLMYNEDMVKHEGEVGTVTSIGMSSFSLEFADDWWGYPLEGAEQYIVDEVEKEKKVKVSTKIKEGDKVKAIRFAEVDAYYKSKSGSHEPRFDADMERRVGEVGTATQVNESVGYVQITFEDGDFWYYPLEALIEDMQNQPVKTIRKFPVIWCVVRKDDNRVIYTCATRKQARDSIAYTSDTKIVKYSAADEAKNVIEGDTIWAVLNKENNSFDDPKNAHAVFRNRKDARSMKLSGQREIKYAPVKG